MKLFYYIDTARWEQKNRENRDYTPAYIPELLTFLGVTGEQWTPEKDVRPEDILFVGAEEVRNLPDCRQIQFGTNASAALKAERCASITDYYLTERGEKLPLFVPLLDANEGWDILRTTENGRPALTRSGTVYRFCFDLPATVWYSGDGAYTGNRDHDFFLGRVSDTRPLPPTMPGNIAYNDLLLNEIEDILTAWDVPMLYRLPPMDAETVPDLALHFSGDDDCTSIEYNLNAATIMHRAGFPYHLNAMAAGGEHFVFDKAVLAELEKLDCEVSLHTDFVADAAAVPKVPYTFESQKAQADLFEKTFGYRALTNTNHYFVQNGQECERLRWLSACGIIGDNGKMGEINIADYGTKEMNAFNLYGFSFGTSFPRYTLDDPEHGNNHIQTMEIPINFYEPRLGGNYPDSTCITEYLDAAAENGRIAQFFIHPHYFMPEIGSAEQVANALALIGEHLAKKKYHVLRTTTNRVALFWQGRRDSTVSLEGSTVTVCAKVPLVLMIPEASCSATSCVNGVPFAGVHKEIRGRSFRLFILPRCGEYTIQL